jgi:hypothetical protein
MSVFGPTVLKKSKYPLDPISAAGAFSERGCGGLVIHARLNGNRSESICGVNQRRSKMSLVFRQIRNDFTLATFSTESDPKLTCTVLANVCFEGEERRWRGLAPMSQFDPGCVETRGCGYDSLVILRGN